MRHRKNKTLSIGRGTDQRRKLLRSLGSSLVLYERIETTLAKGRAARSYVERVVTKAKDSSLHSRRQVLEKLTPMAAKKAMEVLGPKYKDRAGGYTRMVKLSSPNAAQSKVVVMFV
jgi:large subunit ribosomal protein L17